MDGGVMDKPISKKRGSWLVTHGMSATTTYKIWQGMINRCTNSLRRDYKYYGAKGIEVCESWKTFTNFFADMGVRPDGAYLDRIDGRKNYSPDNCRWVNPKQSAWNRSNSRMVTIDGETRCLTEWCERLNIKPSTVHARVYVYGWEPVKALTFPVSKGGGLNRELANG